MVNKFKTPIFRVSFPSVFEATSMQENGPKKYSLAGIWEPGLFTSVEKGLWKAILDACDEVSVSAFKKKIAALPANYKRPIRDGEEKADLGGYGPGKMFATMSSKMRPGLVDIAGHPITDPDDFYPGCYARATVTMYSYNKGGGMGVALGLQNLQKVRDGDRLDSRTDAADDFGDDIEEDDRDPLDD